MPLPPDLFRLPIHVAIIMDGNGRWARRRGLPRIMGHRQGAKAVRKTVRAAREFGIRILTLFAFSQENWHRPQDEVDSLMDLLHDYLFAELNELVTNGISLRGIGDCDRLPSRVRDRLLETIERTAICDEMILNLAISYGARSEIAHAARLIAEKCLCGEMLPSDIDERTVSEHLFTKGLPDPDLLIRTSGEYRLSNFLLFQAAYTELYVTDVLWPDFGRDEFLAALREYQRRERRFGLTGEQVARIAP